jgi:hypothetical protein
VDQSLSLSPELSLSLFNLLPSTIHRASELIRSRVLCLTTFTILLARSVATHDAEQARARLLEKETQCETYRKQLLAKQQQTQMELQKVRMEFQEKLLRVTSQGNDLSSSSDIWRRRLMDIKVRER